MSQAPLPVIREPAAATTTVIATEALAAARAYARDALAPETKRAYAADWAHFTTWCHAAGCTPLPAEPAAVAAYLAAMAPLYSRAALERRLAAIGQQHRLRGLDWSAGHPAIRTTLRGVLLRSLRSVVAIYRPQSVRRRHRTARPRSRPQLACRARQSDEPGPF